MRPHSAGGIKERCPDPEEELLPAPVYDPGIPGQKTEGLAVYQKDVQVDSQVISDIADFINSID